jgi:hypothetical protein
MKKYQVLVIGTYITREVMASSPKEAKEKAKILLNAHCPIPGMRLKATEIA